MKQPTSQFQPTRSLRSTIRRIPGSIMCYRMLHSIREYVYLIRCFFQFRKMAGMNSYRMPVRWGDRLPCLWDRTSTTTFDRHYIYHPAWAARILLKNEPQLHIDISSSLTFCSMLSAVIPVKFFDYRPANLKLSNLECSAADLMALPFEDKSVESISCMHVIEHIGLGRYGDPIDPEGDIKAMKELQRVVATNGTLLIVVPVGKPRIQFNAHRIYSWEMITNTFSELKLISSALLPDEKNGDTLIIDPEQNIVSEQEYGCGCFWFKRT